MKKILSICMMILMLTTIVGISTNEVKAQYNGYYDFYCSVNQYEVSYITDDGKFEKVSCHDSFSKALSEMRKNDDYVVRHYNSKSPTMIIAMNSGNAYTYPARSGSVTMNLYEDLYDRSAVYKKTYVANHYEMRYEGTELYFESGVGMIKATLNGFEGYVDLENTDLVPDKFLDNELMIVLGGNDKTSQNEQPYVVTVRRNFYTVTNDELVFVYHRSYSSKGGYDEEHRIVLGPAPSEFDANTRYYSSNGYQFYYDPNETDYALTYYPYYQYLPVRSKSNISADDLDKAFYEVSGKAHTSKMEDAGSIFIEAQERYGINALLLYAMAAHESGWGTSSYAMNRNNLFGWNAIDSNPNNASSFPNLTQGIYEHAGYNLRKYTDVYSSLFFGSHLGNKGSGFNVQYASDPYWGMDIAAIAYQIDKASGLKDYENYSFAVVSEFNAEFTDEDGDIYFTSQYGPDYQECFTVIVLNKADDRTIVQSPNPIDNGTVIVTYNGSGNGDGPTELANTVYEYDFDESIVYIDTDALSFVSEGDYEVPDVPDDDDGEELPDDLPTINGMNQSYLTSVEVSNEYLYLNGVAFTYGRDYKSDTTHDILIYDAQTDKVVKTAKVTTKTTKKGLNYNDGYVYDYVGYEATINLSSLSKGKYYIMIQVDDPDFYKPFAVSDSRFNGTGTQKYLITPNENMENRIEIEVLANKPSNIYLSKLNKPSQRYSASTNIVSLNQNTDKIEVDGYGWIFYTDFLNSDDVKYQLYLVGDNNIYNLSMGDGNYDEGVIDFNSRTYSNTYENIFYDGNCDLSKIAKGEYKLYLEIRKGDYFDYIVVKDYSEPNDEDKVNGKYFTLKTNDNAEVVLTVK